MYRGPSGQYYNPLNHFISELGYIGVSDFAWLFNGGIIIGGLLIACFMWGLGGKLKTRLYEISSFVGVIAGVLEAFIGFFSMNNLNIHIIVAMSFFITSTITMMLYSIAIYKDTNQLLPKTLVLYGLLVFVSFIIFLFNPFDSAAINLAGSLSTENNDNLETIRPEIWSIAILECVSILSILIWAIIISIVLKKNNR